MSESDSHKRVKSKAAGRNGKKETPLSYKRRLDAETKHKATEVERSGATKGLEKAARRLKASGKSQKVLQVPQKDMNKATKAMKNTGTSGSIKNMTGTKRRSVRK